MISISDIKLELNNCQTEESFDTFILNHSDDTRSGVVSLINKAIKLKGDLIKEKERTESLKVYEHKYEDLGYIAGIDEVGRGPLAGPVVTCAVILPKDCDILYLNDSKQLSAKKREELYDIIMEKAVSVSIASRSHTEIDDTDILKATLSAMKEAVLNLSVKPAVLLNDAVTIPGVDIKQIPIIKGDAKSVSIAAASIVAKVTRDRLMVEMDAMYPGYDFASNKGYGSAKHIQGIKELGPCEIHRRSFIKNFI